VFDKILDFFRGANGGKSRFAGKTILVVDDGEVERAFISRVLEKRGYKVFTAADGKQGLSLSNRENIDLVVLDYYMPGCNGKEVCEDLKRNEKTKDIPVIFLTGSASAKNVVECFDVGAEYFLRKPISGGELIKQIEMILSELEAVPPAE